MKKFLGKILLLVAIGLVGRYCELTYAAYQKTHHHHWVSIEGVIVDIVIGMIVIAVFGQQKFFKEIFAAGIDKYMIFLKLGIVFAGAKFLLANMLKLGVMGITLVPLVLLTSAITFALIGKLFGLSLRAKWLLAVGQSICGVSAIAATKPAINATEEEQTAAMGAIMLSGGMSIAIFPIVGHLLHLSNNFFGVWVGLGVDNTAEVAATGTVYSEAARGVAVMTKSVRNACIGPVALGSSMYFSRKGMAEQKENKFIFLLKSFPLFVLGMIIVSALASAKLFNPTEIATMVNFSQWMFWLTFAGVGLSLNFRTMSKNGLKILAVGALGEICGALTAYLLVYGWQYLFGLNL